VIRRTEATSNRQHDGANDCKADQLADDERGAIDAALCG